MDPERTPAPRPDALLAGTALRERAALALDVPIIRALGARLLDQDDPPGGVGLVVDDLALNGAGGMHASALAAAMETAGYLALLPHLTVGEHAVTHTVTLNLVRAVPAGAAVLVSGLVDRRTRRMAFVSVEAAVDGRVVARAQLVKSVVPLVVVDDR